MTPDPSTHIDEMVPPPDVYVGHLLRRAQQVHVAAWTRYVSTETSSVQFAALSVLARAPGSSQAALGRALDLDRSTIADLVRRMVASDLLSRHRSVDDSRRYVLRLTERGQRLLDELQPRVQGLETVLTAGLDVGEAAEFHRLLRVVLDEARTQGLLASAAPTPAGAPSDLLPDPMSRGSTGRSGHPGP